MMWKHMRRNSIQLEGEHSSSLDLCTSRLTFLGVFFILAFLIIGLRLLDLGLIQGEIFRVDQAMDAQNVVAKSDSVRRGNIYDRNGVLLAANIKAASLFADPALILEPEKTLRDLKKIFPDIREKRVLKGLKGSGRFVWVERGITPAQQKKVLELGQPGLSFKYEDQRVYPLGASAAHIVGYTDLDGRGLSGIERNFDEALIKGLDVHLTLDSRVQHIIKRETQRAMDEYTGIAGAALVMDAKSGEILAGVSLPDYDLNLSSLYAEEPQENEQRLFNRLTLGVYELGSMFKIFSTAAFLETHENGLDQAFDVRKPIKIGRFTIDDFKGKKRILSIPEVFVYSSNIGTANMGRMVGGEYLHGFYKDLGLLDPMHFDIREVGKPRSPAVPWKEVSVLTASYGHGLSTTPLQMAAAVATVVNGGFRVQPRLTLTVEDEDATRLRILSPETSDKMCKLMRMTVTQGTGSKADVEGYSVGGKTGTAEKSVDGRYENKKLISSFVSAFPMDNPRYVVMVMVDEPKPNKDSHGYATAGWVAAPAVGRIVTSMASILGLPADHYDPEKDLGLAYLPYVREPVERAKKPKETVEHKIDPSGVRHVSY